MDGSKYLDHQVRLLKRTGARHLFGDYKWLPSDASIPEGRIILAAEHSFSRWLPSLAITDTYVAGGMRILRARELFSERYLVWKLWSPSPIMPSARDRNAETKWDVH